METSPDGAGAARRTWRARIRWAAETRAIRFPMLVTLGAVVTCLASYLVYLNYGDFCRRYAVFPGRCSPVRLRTALATGLGIAGLVMLVLGPVVNSLYHLFRYGQKWEFSRVETAVSNYPLLAGVLYLAAGGLLAFL